MKPEGYVVSTFQKVPDREELVPYVVTVKRSTLLRVIRESGIDVPPNAEVTFRVPGGGDYSNCDVSLDEVDQVITVRYKK